MKNLPSALQVYQNQGVKARGNGMTDTSKKYLDFPVNKGKKGGSRISKAIGMDYDTYHRTKGK